MISQPAPLLESLSIEFIMTPEVTNFFYLPDGFLDSQAPKLRTLSLATCSLPWTSPLYTNLTSFQFAILGSYPIPADRILDSLERMPELLHLKLKIVSLDPTQLPLEDRMVKVPKLTELTLDGPLQVRHLLLPHIAIPSSARACLICTGAMQDILGLVAREDVPPLPRSISPMDPDSTHQLRLTSIQAPKFGSQHWPSGIFLHLWPDRINFTSGSSNGSNTPLPPPPVVIDIDKPIHLRLLNLADVRTASYAPGSPDVLRDLPMLEEIYLTGSQSAHDFFYTEANFPDLSRNQAPIRHLKTVTFEKTTFTKSAIVLGSTSHSYLPILRVLQFLSDRSSVGAAVDKIVLKDCANLTQETIMAFKTQVKEVVWDRAVIRSSFDKNLGAVESFVDIALKVCPWTR
ncbi:hypothetical protein CC2G_012426 [Coprinopsis cinerea AmutBmut pab1-1]|nr:hypothetical protein CC2G_012426 [Coprinopsis cinerea AmutBmut pab1-1]